jgi:DNA repair exonuclease SbcCD ATPase subunit
MSRDESDNFKFGSDQINPDDVLREVPEDNRIARLSRRVTLLAILLPILIGAALYFLYDDLKNRVAQNQTYGTQSVEGLAKTLETGLQEFSAKLTQIETTLSERLSGTEKNAANLKTQADKTESSLKTALGSLKTIDGAKADKKDQESLVSQVTALSTQMNARYNDISERLADLTAVTPKMANDIIKLRTEMTALADTKMDRKTLQQELEKQQQKLSALSTDLDTKIAALQNTLRRLEKDLQQTRQSLHSSPGPAPVGSGGIIEKELD